MPLLLHYLLLPVARCPERCRIVSYLATKECVVYQTSWGNNPPPPQHQVLATKIYASAADATNDASTIANTAAAASVIVTAGTDATVTATAVACDAAAADNGSTTASTALLLRGMWTEKH